MRLLSALLSFTALASCTFQKVESDSRERSFDSFPISWENPSYTPCKDASHEKAHPHLQFVPEGLTLLDGTEKVTTRHMGVEVQPVTLAKRYATIDPTKKIVIFVLGYDGSGRAYDFFETQLWNKSFNTFVFRWHCEYFTEDLVLDDVFESTDNGRARFLKDLEKLRSKIGNYYEQEIRIVSISAGGQLVLDALSEANPFPRGPFLSFNADRSRKYDRRVDFLDPFLPFESAYVNRVIGTDGQEVPGYRYNEVARKIKAIQDKGYITTAFTSAYTTVLTKTLSRWMSVQQQHADWLSDDYGRLKNGEALGQMMGFAYDSNRSQFDYQHIGIVPAYFESLKEDVLPMVLNSSSMKEAITAKTKIPWIQGKGVYLRQSERGKGTLTLRDDDFEVVEDPCRSGVVIDQGSVTNPTGGTSVRYEIPFFCK